MERLPPRRGANQKRGYRRILEEVTQRTGVPAEQILSGSRERRACRARREFFLQAHEETGESMAALGRCCGMAHTSVREAIDRARQERGSGQ
jgi:putative transposase